MSDRVDEVVQYVRKMHNEWLSAEERKEDDRGGDVVIVSHGHFSRCFVARWLGLPLKDGQLFTVDVGGVSPLSRFGFSIVPVCTLNDTSPCCVFRYLLGTTIIEQTDPVWEL